jgi:Ni,Fe-hydrogenase III large subunit
MFKALFGNLAAIASHRGWPRFEVDADAWQAIGQALREGKLDLLGEWGDAGVVHCALFEPPTGELAVASIAATEGRVPTLAAFHPAAMRLERAIVDLWGLQITGLPDRRRWLDHGHWPRAAPLASRPPKPASAEPYRFLESEGPGLHQIPVGPVHAGIIEPGHFRFTANGETVVRLEERLGYTHKGIEALLSGRTIGEGTPIAARVSGDSTVAYSLVFARAIEAALGSPAPRRAVWLRAVMAELERVANHLGDIGAICNDAAFSMMHAECGILREETLRACQVAFGHRLMMDRVVPGGTAVDLAPAGRDAIYALTQSLRRRFPELIELYENTASLQDRTVGTGVVSPALAADFAAGGFVGRASGRVFDARSALVYEPYDSLPVKPVVRREGDVDARVWVRIEEVRASIDWLEAAIAALPDGPFRREDFAAPTETREATAIVEGFRGDVLAYLRLAPDRRIERCHLRDPSWFQWPLLEVAIDGNIVADFPLCNKSFNCSYSGHDL